MNHFVAVILVGAVTAATGFAGDRIFSQDDVDRLNAANDLSMKEMAGQAEVAPGLILPFYLGLTTKGNGVLTIGGLGIRFYDNHQDLITFAGGCLDHRFVDVDGDGFKDLVFLGTVQKWSEKRKFLSERPILAVFHFDHRNKQFVNTVSDPDLYVFAQTVSDAAK